MRGYTADQVRAAETPLLERGEPLMRRASAGLAEAIRDELARNPADGVLLLAGSGDNGGDGLFAVAELAASGVPVRVVAVTERLHRAGAAAAREAGAVVDLRAADDPEGLAASLADDVLLVDAIVGIGALGVGLRGRGHAVVAALLARRRGRASWRVVAVDLPSGIGVDNGAVPEDGVLLPAELTVTFGAVKVGLLLPPASLLVGELRLVDIGLGPQLADVEPAVVVGRS